MMSWLVLFLQKQKYTETLNFQQEKNEAEVS